MSVYRLITFGGRLSTLGLFLVLTVLGLSASSNTALAADGKAIFQGKCASCHHPLKDGTGPALKGVSGRTPGKEWIYKWIHNSAAVIASGDKYAVDLYAKWKANMTAFPELSTEEIDAVIGYVETYAPPAPPPGGGGDGAGMKAGNGADAPSNNNFLYLTITAILAICAFALVTINKKLQQTAAEKVGYPIKKEVPILRHKLYLAIFGIIGFLALGAWMTKSGIKLGRQQDYQPVQPIYYSHKVHAGINQINCQYCHSAAEKGKHSMIPSFNVCMNCHKGIKEYTGAEEHPLTATNGDRINGTEEIAKLYDAVGWDVEKKAYTNTPHPDKYQWVKIHNLPDHVAFSHATHVKNGQVACQRCHGEIQEMDEVYQFSDLSMGFCINCHREQKVQFKENNYYAKIYQKYHDEIKAKTRDSVTVAEIGGLECAKCHH
jgi:mono/diheme cytochrome c family protein